MSKRRLPPPKRPIRSGRPLLTACLIVKDEEEVIERCLASLLPVVDEIVVHDTGSTDATIEICERMGARVIRGEWRDDFAWARNVSIEAARGQWVIILDADEALVETNYPALRTLLEQSKLDAYRAFVHNMADFTGSVTLTNISTRLFKKKYFRYEGRLHEQVVSIAPRAVSIDSGAMFELRHWGYLPEVVESKNKAERNIRIALSQHETLQTDKSILETARAYSLSNDAQSCFAAAEPLRYAEDLNIRQQALHLGIQMLIKLDRKGEALEWAEETIALGLPSGMTTYLHGFALANLQRWEEAVDVLSQELAFDQKMQLGINHSVDTQRTLLARCLVNLERHDEAVDTYLKVAESGPIDVWCELLQMLYIRGEMHRGVEPFLRMDLEGSSQRLRGILAGLLTLPIAVGDRFAEMLWEASPGDNHVLAFVAMNGQRLELDRAIIWSARARAAGQDISCPLLRQSNELELSPTQRITAAALALDLHHDDRAVEGLSRAARDLADTDVLEALYTVGELAPAALEPFVLGVVSSQERALVMAEALAELHAEEQAAAVLRLGLEVDADSPAATTRLHGMLQELEGVPG